MNKDIEDFLIEYAPRVQQEGEYDRSYFQTKWNLKKDATVVRLAQLVNDKVLLRSDNVILEKGVLGSVWRLNKAHKPREIK